MCQKSYSRLMVWAWPKRKARIKQPPSKDLSRFCLHIANIREVQFQIARLNHHTEYRLNDECIFITRTLRGFSFIPARTRKLPRPTHLYLLPDFSTFWGSTYAQNWKQIRQYSKGLRITEVERGIRHGEKGTPSGRKISGHATLRFKKKKKRQILFETK
jgi:hypothetical protein